jgi:hypothetical protein
VLEEICLKVRSGLKSDYLSSSPDANGKELEAEKRRFQYKWKQRLESFDPFYNHGILDDNNIDRGHFRQWILGEYN